MKRFFGGRSGIDAVWREAAGIAAGRKRNFYVLLACLTFVPGGAPAPAAAAQEPPAVGRAVIECDALKAGDFSLVQDAPTQITDARPIEAAGAIPAYCRVEGYVTPRVGIELWMPVSNWNGRFLHVGCGGFCGSMLFMFKCIEPLVKGYACITTDMGHKSTLGDGKWAYNDLQAEVDFGFRATHVTTLAGKAIVERFYGKRPEKSYFHGCSCGGRQALVEAQRFPWDFDGIIAGAPAINLSDIVMEMQWYALAVKDKNGNPLFKPESVALLHGAVVAKCDLNDGLKDGLIGDPRKCKFDPGELLCRANSAGQCFSPEQVQAVRSIYAGPRTSTGEKVGTDGPPPGSEMSYMGSFLTDRPEGPEYMRYMGFASDPGPAWQGKNFDFDRDYKRLGTMEAIYAAANPDLRKFKAAGGKIILYHGWADGAIAPGNSIDYYELVERTMGGRAATQDFFRLFMVPDMDHCWGGAGASSIDYLSYLEAWVERGEAPDKMIGAHAIDPADPSKIDFTRPVYPYPLVAKYKGSRDPRKAESFKPVEP